MDGILDHTMIRVSDLDASLNWYGTHFDYEEKGRWEADTFTLVFLGPENVHDQGALLELTYNHGTHDYDLGDAWGHLAVRVDDLSEAYGEPVAGGVEDYRDPASCNDMYAFVKDPDGYEIELIERDYGEQWSLDHTMIRVEDVDAALGWFVRKLEYENTGRWEADTFANYYVKRRGAADESMAVELTYNYDGRTYDAGDAWGHLAVRADDLHEYWETLMERGAEDYRDPESCDDNYAFTRDIEGRDVEILVPDEAPIDRI
jgi:lactoylglutathione lyase